MTREPGILSRWREYRLVGVIFTLLMLALMALAMTTVQVEAAILALAFVTISVALFLTLFPGSRFFVIAVVNYLAIYAGSFSFLSEQRAERLDPIWSLVGFSLPILALLAGAIRQRNEIRAMVTSEELRLPTDLPHASVLMLPLIFILLGAFLLPSSELSDPTLNTVFVSVMAALSVLIFLLSRTVCVFLLDTGLLFEDFFRRIRVLFIPAFAFMTFYSMIVLVYACIYRILDYYSGLQHFIVQGADRDITFPESVYFSIITLSTVGYGDVVPYSDLVRIIVATEIVFGVLLILFGFSEILRYSRERVHEHIRHGPPHE